MTSEGIGRGNNQTLGPWGKAKCQGENPQSGQLPFLSFMPSHIKLVKEVISLGWERYGGQIRIWEVTHFWKVCF